MVSISFWIFVVSLIWSVLASELIQSSLKEYPLSNLETVHNPNYESERGRLQSVISQARSELDGLTLFESSQRTVESPNRIHNRQGQILGKMNILAHTLRGEGPPLEKQRVDLRQHPEIVRGFNSIKPRISWRLHNDMTIGALISAHRMPWQLPHKYYELHFHATDKETRVSAICLAVMVVKPSWVDASNRFELHSECICRDNPGQRNHIRNRQVYPIFPISALSIGKTFRPEPNDQEPTVHSHQVKKAFKSVKPAVKKALRSKYKSISYRIGPLYHVIKSPVNNRDVRYLISFKAVNIKSQQPGNGMSLFCEANVIAKPNGYGFWDYSLGGLKCEPDLDAVD